MEVAQIWRGRDDGCAPVGIIEVDVCMVLLVRTFRNWDIDTGHSKAIRARNPWEGEALSSLEGIEHDMSDRKYVLLVNLSSGGARGC